ncbi:hypothetical protein CDAR_401711 [Caerostris darwini]|uniref:Uncharacterized protein n=1 Tax=Caerostris darwini TaxID=1538125 RepID=A0AAV4RXA0_9ARAC|nr:hypothetical protein CDAR_401711 [Caerostris darwini]
MLLDRSRSNKEEAKTADNEPEGNIHDKNLSFEFGPILFRTPKILQLNFPNNALSRPCPLRTLRVERSRTKTYFNPCQVVCGRDASSNA